MVAGDQQQQRALGTRQQCRLSGPQTTESAALGVRPSDLQFTSLAGDPVQPRVCKSLLQNTHFTRAGAFYCDGRTSRRCTSVERMNTYIKSRVNMYVSSPVHAPWGLDGDGLNFSAPEFNKHQVPVLIWTNTLRKYWES